MSNAKTLYPCGICYKNVKNNAIECSMCMYWVHLRCAKLRKKDLKHLHGDAIWFCENCKSALPFHDRKNDELLYLYNDECSFHNNNSSQSLL